MSAAALDRLLALLLAAQVASGLLTLRSGVPATAPLFWLHGLIGGALLVAAIWKLKRSIGPAVAARRWGRLALGALLALLAAGALVGGFTWVASGRILSIGPWTILTIHVWFGLAIVPIVIFHLIPRRWRLLRPRTARGPRRGPTLSRRTLLASVGVIALGAVAWATANLLDAVQGGVRRFTGSRWLPVGGIPPPTTFYGEPAPPVDPDAWRLQVSGRVAAPLSLDLASLAALGETERSAVLDCTSGWVMRTDWRGVPLTAVLDAAGADERALHVVVSSVTGWNVALSRGEAAGTLLATHVAGEPLPVANGAPCRLVAPDRRGLDWIKWIDRIEVA